MDIHPPVLWAQRSSTHLAEGNVVYLTIDIARVIQSTMSCDITETAISFKAKGSDNPERNYAFKFTFYAGIIPQQSKKYVTARSLVLCIRKRDKKAEYWPRLTREKTKLAFIKTDFERWVDEDEQDHGSLAESFVGSSDDVCRQDGAQDAGEFYSDSNTASHGSEGTVGEKGCEERGMREDVYEDRQRKVAFIPDDNVDELNRLNDLGLSLWIRYNSFGDAADLDGAILNFKSAVSMTPDGHPEKPTRLGNLGAFLEARFKLLGEISDLDDATVNLNNAVRLTPDGHPYKPGCHSNLGISLQSRFERLGEISDLDNAILNQKTAVRLTHDDHPDKPTCLNNLGTSLQARFERLGEISNLDDAILNQKAAVRLTPNGHPDKPSRLSNLGAFLEARFKRLGEISDLDDAILDQKAAVRLTPDGHPDKPSCLNNLGNSLQSRFECLGEIPDLDDAILNQKNAVRLTPDGHPEKPALLNNLGNALQMRFERLGKITDLDDAILNQKSAVRSTPDGHPGKPSRLNNLGNSLHSRFDCLGEISDLDDAILNQKTAVRLTPDGHRDKPDVLSNFGCSLQRRFKRLGEISDLDDAILNQKTAVRLTPDGHTGKPALLNNLSISLQSRFERLGEISDLDDAILNQKTGVRLTPDSHPDKPACLNNLGDSLQMRFKRLDEMPDLDDAILNQKTAVRLTPDGHPDKPGRLNNLGISLQSRFKRLGEIPDLDDAILNNKTAVRLTPDGHPDKPARLNNLGNALQMRFERLDEISDLDDAILNQKTAVRSTPDGHPDKPARLNNLGNALQMRFERLDEIPDLDDAILNQKTAVRLTPDGHLDKPGRLTNLGISLQSRFKRLGEIPDLDDAILNQKTAVRLTPDGHPDKPGRLNNLGISLRSRFKRLGEIPDLDDAILNQKAAVRLTPDGHPDKPGCLGNLGNSLQSRFEHLGEMPDLDDAILNHKTAVRLTPDGHPDIPAFFNHLGTSLQGRFERLGEISDLDNATLNLNNAVRLTPDGHSDKPMYLYNLGVSLETRYDHGRDIEDHKLCIDAWSRSAYSPVGRPIIQYDAARRWSLHVQKHRHTLSLENMSILEAYRSALNLLPRLAWLGQAINSRLEALKSTTTLACDAASAAIESYDTKTALEWLEQGRSIVWGQTLRLRTPLDAVHDVAPNLAMDLARVSTQLEQGGSLGRSKGLATNEDPGLAAEVLAQAQRRLADEHDKLVQAVRLLPGFEHFLQPTPYSKLSTAAAEGPVVVLNLSRYRCDAFIVASPDRPPSSIKLDLTYHRAEELQTSLRETLLKGHYRERDGRHCGPGLLPGFNSEDESFRELLAELWTSVAKPILDHLEYQRSPSNQLPRIWWCPTGPLVFLPIHAAGLYNVNGTNNVSISDYAISSYTPTLTALITANEPRLVPFSLLTVSQPNTPGKTPLTGTTKETRRIQQHAFGLETAAFDGAEATRASVLAGLRKHSWVHLACHGVQETVQPTQSGLELEDGRLRLSKIIKERLPHADFAFLSACQTATGGEEHPDEAIHIAAGMLSAGYRSVIATMWSIGDDDAPLVADLVYADLLSSEQPDSREAARALHFAIRKLRETKKGKSFASWVPFIHIGI